MGYLQYVFQNKELFEFGFDFQKCLFVKSKSKPIPKSQQPLQSRLSQLKKVKKKQKPWTEQCKDWRQVSAVSRQQGLDLGRGGEWDQDPGLEHVHPLL